MARGEQVALSDLWRRGSPGSVNRSYLETFELAKSLVFALFEVCGAIEPCDLMPGFAMILTSSNNVWSCHCTGQSRSQDETFRYQCAKDEARSRIDFTGLRGLLLDRTSFQETLESCDSIALAKPWLLVRAMIIQSRREYYNGDMNCL